MASTISARALVSGAKDIRFRSASQSVNVPRIGYRCAAHFLLVQNIKNRCVEKIFVKHTAKWCVVHCSLILGVFSSQRRVKKKGTWYNFRAGRRMSPESKSTPKKKYGHCSDSVLL